MTTAIEVKELLEAERAAVPFLQYCAAGGRQCLRRLEDEPVLTIGRDPSCHIALAWDDSVSRTHAVLERLGQAWTIADDGISRNGTFLNGTKLASRRRLVDGDTLLVGRTTLRFRSPVEAAAGATSTGQPLLAAPVTQMQRRVLVALCRPLLAAGDRYAGPASNSEIAAELVLSVDAVKTHLRGLAERLAVGDLPQNQKRAKVAELALRTGLVTERDVA
jgi:pSer/pThr/pTyr-binding forkhead associated (FHA) protein